LPSGYLLAAIRDGAILDVEFLDGASLRGRPSAFGLYSIRLQTDDGSEAIVFKHGLRALRRCA